MWHRLLIFSFFGGRLSYLNAQTLTDRAVWQSDLEY